MNHLPPSEAATRQRIIDLSLAIVALCNHLPDVELSSVSSPVSPPPASSLLANDQQISNDAASLEAAINPHQGSHSVSPAQNPSTPGERSNLETNAANLAAPALQLSAQQSATATNTTVELAHQITLLILECRELRRQSDKIEKDLQQVTADLQRLTRIMGISSSLQF